jgi:hypothetical protein
MRAKAIKCPTCGRHAEGVIDKVVAEIQHLRNGKFEWTGDTNLDTQTALLNDAGERQLICYNGHTWWTKVTGEE